MLTIIFRSFCSTLAQVAVLNPFFTPFLLMFAGLVQTPKQMPGFWRVCRKYYISLQMLIFC